MKGGILFTSYLFILFILFILLRVILHHLKLGSKSLRSLSWLENVRYTSVNMDRLLYFISILIIWIVSNYCLKLGETIKIINDESLRVKRSIEQQLRRDGYVFSLREVNVHV